MSIEYHGKNHPVQLKSYLNRESNLWKWFAYIFLENMWKQ